jgi:SAM-dependent methyltransferase
MKMQRDELDVPGWLRDSCEPVFSKEFLKEYYQTVSPRVVFLKNLQPGSRVVDLGAGGGELAILREWPVLKRADLRLFAVSLERGRLFDSFEEVFIGNFEKAFPSFSVSQFEGIICAHFIEHMQDFARTICWMADNLAAGGRAYIEWPHACSKKLTTKSQLAKLGYAVSTTNFFDDATHVETWAVDDMIAEAHRYGCTTEAWGRIRMPFIAEQMRNYAVQHNDEVMLTFAIWSFFGWAQYLIISKTA